MDGKFLQDNQKSRSIVGRPISNPLQSKCLKNEAFKTIFIILLLAECFQMRVKCTQHVTRIIMHRTCHITDTQRTSFLYFVVLHLYKSSHTGFHFISASAPLFNTSTFFLLSMFVYGGKSRKNDQNIDWIL